jgi:hypothetical protein
LYQAIIDGDTEVISTQISDVLMSTISYYDSRTEAFYHGLMAGILQNMNNYYLKSNQESGNGRPDLIVRYNSLRGIAVIMEFKYSKRYLDMEKMQMWH